MGELRTPIEAHDHRGGTSVTDPILLLRIALLTLVVVLVQIVAVSQVSIFGVNADLSPLLIASIALLCGSIPGALVGFGVGLFIDLALVQTLGLSSLILTVIGYGAGRLRELRDPQAPLVPLAVGALASAVALVGYAVMQFMLGVDAPVSFLLLRQIVVGVAVDSVLALPLFALVRRVLEPSLPGDPRRRRRRAYTTGGLSPISRP
jgi:rod shape-determining protein MreD